MARQYPHGESPFMSPKAGDVIRSTKNGLVRTVVSTVRDDIDYVIGAVRGGDQQVFTSTKDSWACWCSRNKAEFVEGRIAR